MYNYYFYNWYTGERTVITCCNLKQYAMDIMRERYGDEFCEWEYDHREGGQSFPID